MSLIVTVSLIIPEIFELQVRGLKRTQWKQGFAALFVLFCCHKAFLCQLFF